MKEPLKLSFINILEDGINKESPLIQVLIGPRQVGKTTTILHHFEAKYGKRILYGSADLVFNSDYAWLQGLWQKAIDQNLILIIDEIQKCENWSEWIKKLWDETRRSQNCVQCILLGSSSLQIQKGLTESLTGRFKLTKAFHWNYEDSHAAYDLSFEDYLKFGGYPGAYQFVNTKDWVNYVKNSIVSTVIEKDILQFQRVKSPSLFKQAFEILISYPAQEVSYTKILGQIQDKGNVDLVKYYISLFEGAFLIKALEKYSERGVKTKSSSPKILPLCPCLYYLTILDDYSSEEKGHAFEALVGAQLCKTDYPLYYWREGDAEVDFVLKIGRKIFGIEVKSGRKKSAKGIPKFKEKFPHARVLIVSNENYFDFERDPEAYLSKFSL